MSEGVERSLLTSEIVGSNPAEGTDVRHCLCSVDYGFIGRPRVAKVDSSFPDPSPS